MGQMASCVGLLPQSPAMGLLTMPASEAAAVRKAHILLTEKPKVLASHDFRHENTLLHELASIGNQDLLQAALKVIETLWLVMDRLKSSENAGSRSISRTTDVQHDQHSASSPEEVVQRFVNARNSKEQTPLILASRNKRDSIIKLLLTNGADPWVADRCGGCTALHYAALGGSVECVRALLDNVPVAAARRGGHRYVNCPTPAGFTPLHLAAAEGHADVVQLLLSYGASMNAASTAISWEPPSVSGINVGSTALHVAAHRDDAATIDAILRHHASPAGHAPGQRVNADPRMFATQAGRLPHELVEAAKDPALHALLAPTMNLQAHYFPEDFARARRFPTLSSLAAATLRAKLLADIAALDRQPTCCTVVSAPAPRSTAHDSAAEAGCSSSACHSINSAGPCCSTGFSVRPRSSLGKRCTEQHCSSSIREVPCATPPNSADTSASSSAADVGSEDEELCGICLEARAVVVSTRPACGSSGHVLCCGCARQIVQNAEAGGGEGEAAGRQQHAAQCPFCRSHIPGFRAVVHV